MLRTAYAQRLQVRRRPAICVPLSVARGRGVIVAVVLMMRLNIDDAALPGSRGV
jgi:hypothetical protein